MERPLRLVGIDPEKAYGAREIKDLVAAGKADEEGFPVIRKIHPKGVKADPLYGFFERTIGGKKVVVEYEADSQARDTEQVPLPRGSPGLLCPGSPPLRARGMD